ncbi:RING finger and SPRY domain-containing protein 1 [Entomortierella parvispora]|uniref:RING finger and SPRY domain-containing protein 1 n=1 Tax=Entomortierella parvispora TaxID=205924 RepID=A0A9P3H4U6_9FUNG|nr:RING finger and SPRY domain-containing protein 1 [Entomortierella parvispora]
MNRMAARLLERVFVKVHIRAAWNKLHNMTEHGELSSALESLIHLTSTDSSYCELIEVMVDMISTDSLGIAAPFLCHIIDMAALPSQQTTRRMSQQLLSKCDPGGLARLRSRKKNRPAAALIWSVLANRLAGEMSATLFSDAVCECLLNNIENDPDMACKVFSIIALEKFSLTGPCKARIMQTNIRSLLRDTANMSTFGLTDEEEIAGITQAKFCAEWSLRNIFREVNESAKSLSGAEAPYSGHYDPESPQTENIMPSQDSFSLSTALLAETAKKPMGTKVSNINVMLNTLDATRHWKLSEDGLSIRNDGSTFESIRATKSVTCGKWFYEVKLVTAGIMQIGWATVHCQFSPEDGTGVGDDIFGFAFDGCRNLIWADGESEAYGDAEPWKAGDILGFYLDVDNAIMECFVNGRSLGPISPLLKDHFGIQAVSGYYPALSFTSFQQATINFGATPFKYPPALPWRNLNDHGIITSEMRVAIVRPRSDSVYGRIQLDPLTGIRLPAMPEEGDEIDYSLLCTICCDHTATVTLQPCGHDGLCVECAYSLDMCPLCRCRIFQRQMVPSTTDTKEPVQGLCISGLSSDNGSTNASRPGLSTSSTATSAWSTEHYGHSHVGSSSGTTTNTSISSDSSSNVQNHRTDTDVASTDHTHAHHHRNRESSISDFHVTRESQYAFTSSEPAFSRRRNTVAAVSGSVSSPSNRLAALELDCLEDPFSPPSTAYFAFLNRPTRPQRSHLHPVDIDNVDPLEMPHYRSAHHHVFSEQGPSTTTTATMTTSQAGSNDSLPSSSSVTSGSQGLPSEPTHGEQRMGGSGLGLLELDLAAITDYDLEEARIQRDVLEDEEDVNEMNVALIDEGREATGSEVMEQSAPDFSESHSIHSRRTSVQFLEPPSSLSMENGTAATNTVLAVAAALASVTGPGSTATGRFGARRASMPSNRLEM